VAQGRVKRVCRNAVTVSCVVMEEYYVASPPLTRDVQVLMGLGETDRPGREPSRSIPPWEIYLLAETVAASTVVSLCLAPLTLIALPAFSSPQLLPENTVALFVRTYVPLTDIVSDGHVPARPLIVPFIVTVVGGGGGAVEAIVVASTVVSVCLVPTTPIASPLLRSAQPLPVKDVAVPVRTYVPLTDIVSDGHVPVRPLIVPFIVTVVGGGEVGGGVGGGVGGAGGGVVVGLATPTVVANTVPSVPFVPTTSAVSPVLTSTQLFPVKAVAPLVRTVVPATESDSDGHAPVIALTAPRMLTAELVGVVDVSVSSVAVVPLTVTPT
jgi:hypothetical protein